MRIIDVGDERYQVISKIESQDAEFIGKLTKMYKERYSDFFLLRSPVNPNEKQHHLICRKIDDAILVEDEPSPLIETKPKKKLNRKTKSKKGTT